MKWHTDVEGNVSKEGIDVVGDPRPMVYLGPFLFVQSELCNGRDDGKFFDPKTTILFFFPFTLRYLIFTDDVPHGSSVHGFISDY